MPERYAIYFAPAAGSALWSLAAQWLGRDPAGGAVGDVEIAGIDTSRRLALTGSARRYGFHATLKAPMALATGRSIAELEQALDAFAARQRPVELGHLRPALLGGFLALMPERQTPALEALAAACVTEFEAFRAPLDESERARRVSSDLEERQIEFLDRYGYPYVLEQFRFHMTLTDRLPEAERVATMAAASRWFGPALETPLVLDRLALFAQPAPGADFDRLADFPLANVAAA